MELRYFLKFILCSHLVSCAAGPCKNEMSNAITNPLNLISKTETREISMSERETPEFQRIYVYKYDGSVQCEPEAPAIPIAQMQAELETAGVSVLEAKNMDGGSFMTQVCGSPTGQIHRFQIAKRDLDKVMALGFKEWIAP